MAETRAIVGGVDYAVGGWGAYEADCRRARWETQKEYVGGADDGKIFESKQNIEYFRPKQNIEYFRPKQNIEYFRPKQNYPNRSYIGSDDATYSLYDASRNRPNAHNIVAVAAINFAKVLSEYETNVIDKLKHGAADSFTLLPITSSQIWSISTDETLGVDEEAMEEITILLNKISTLTGVPSNQESAQESARERSQEHTSKMVSVDDDKAVLDLEQSVVSRLEFLERRQAQLATLLEKCAKTLANKA